MSGGVDAVAFLSRAAAYSGRADHVDIIETHMSWVFLAGDEVYKLKKPIRYDELDFSSPELRRRHCEEEVRLNRRLAHRVYLGVSALTAAPDGTLAIDGSGPSVDWLVRMRRLPADGHLEALIRTGRAAREAVRIDAAARHVAAFFAGATPERLSAAAYRDRLRAGCHADHRILSHPRYGLPRSRVDALVAGQVAFLEAGGERLDARVASGRLVDGHGDLRPEHVWVIPEPAVLDAIEFSRALRITDPLDELSFLALECERLGAPAVGRQFLNAYVAASGDAPDAWLCGFYRVYRALRRATIAARHLDDESVADAGPFLARARQYLEMVEPLSGPPR